MIFSFHALFIIIDLRYFSAMVVNFKFDREKSVKFFMSLNFLFNSFMIAQKQWIEKPQEKSIVNKF